MVLIVKIFSVIIIIYGCVLVLRPKILKKIVEEMKKNNNIYVINGIKSAISALLVVAAPSTRVPWIVFFFGALGLLTGICMFLFKKNMVERIIAWIEARSTQQVCVMGTVAVVVGVLLALAA